MLSPGQILLLIFLTLSLLVLSSAYFLYFKSGTDLFNRLILYFAALFKLSFFALYITILLYIGKFIKTFTLNAAELAVLFIVIIPAGFLLLLKDGFLKNELNKLRIR